LILLAECLQAEVKYNKITSRRSRGILSGKSRLKCLERASLRERPLGLDQLTPKNLHNSVSQKTEIKPGGLGLLSTLSEARRYKELFFFLFWRDISVRYKQTIFGVLWIIVTPLMSAGLFTLIRLMLGRDTGTEKGPEVFIIVLCGMVPWAFFSKSLSRASSSLTGSSALITKVYFPRIIIPLASALAGLVDFAIGMLIVIAFLIYGAFLPASGINPGWQILLFAPFVVLSFILAVSIGLFFGAVNVRYRDANVILGYLMSMGMHASAVWWPLAKIPEKYRLLVACNPFVGMMEGFRWSLVGGKFPAIPLLITLAFTLVMMVAGYKYFMKVERTFADVI